MAELDPGRQEMLLSHLNPAMQVFLTTTHLDARLSEFLRTSESGRIFKVSSGSVTLEKDQEENGVGQLL